MSESRVNWPEKSGLHTVVQLELDGEPYLMFPTGGLDNTHPTILGTFLQRHGIKYSIPIALEGERYRAPGMGLADLDVEQRTAFFFGSSRTYRIGIDRSHLDKIKELEPDWKIDMD